MLLYLVGLEILLGVLALIRSRKFKGFAITASVAFVAASINIIILYLLVRN